MSAIVLIPARMAASRLPGKPMADIGGEPMIARVARCALAAGVGEVVVAAAEAEIAKAARKAGARAVLTDPALPSGSDRILAALRTVDPEQRCGIAVNLQGDMPFVAAEVLRACIAALEEDPAADIGTVVAPEASPADRTNPDVVKAVITALGRALYFTRGALYGQGPVWRHVGIYAYRRAALERFCAAPPSPLERREKLEQLRALELGMTFRAAIVAAAPLSVDTAADLAAARAFAEREEVGA